MPSFITLTVALILPLLALSSPLYSNVSTPSSADAPFPKRGLIFHNPSSQYIQSWNGAGSQVNWAYNWDSVMGNTFPEWTEYIPMLWGTSSDHTSGARSLPFPFHSINANAALSRGSGHLLAFNEPDGCQSGVQACLSAQDAANAYMQYMMPFANKASLGAPAVSNGASGLPWLKNFLSACASLGCRVDFVPIHWYDSATNIAYFQNYLNEAHDAAGERQIWLTEQQASFLQQVMPWMDQQSWIFRYSWFWCDPSVNPLMVDGNGNPTDLGQVYAYTWY
ncbi:glycoside hydrolase family 128 protein [Hyaloscypha variabilis]